MGIIALGQRELPVAFVPLGMLHFSAPHVAVVVEKSTGISELEWRGRAYFLVEMLVPLTYVR